VIKLVAAAVLLVVVGAAVGTWHVRRTQLQRVITSASAVDTVIDQWRSDRADILADLPSAHYRTAGAEAQVARRLQRTTDAARTALRDATTRVRRVRLRGPLSDHAGTARDSYVRYARAWSGYLSRVVDDPGDGIDTPPPAFDANRGTARAAFRAAAAPFGGDALDRRITALFSH
jgi:hypothetical protein